ncbi:PMF1 factor, partial [Glaucidium brasilianum]|nr:PMF1 factor [Glaucidium brasilianum]
AGGGSGLSVPAAPGRAQVFAAVVDTFLEKLVAAGRAHQQDDGCVSLVWALLNPCGVLPSQEEIQEIKDEGNLEQLFNSLDKIVEEAKNREEPAWRPSGIPEEDICSAMVPYLLKHRAYLQKMLKEKEEENRKVAESVLAGRDKIAELQQLIEAHKCAWQ